MVKTSFCSNGEKLRAPLKGLVHGGGGGDDVARGDRTMLLIVVLVVHAKS